MPAELLVKVTDVGMYVQEKEGGEMNKITGVIAGQSGVAITLPIVDVDGVAKDLSAFTAVIVKAIHTDGQPSASFTGSISSATGGLITITPSTTVYFTRDGNWIGQAQFSDTGIYAPTVPFVFVVEKQL
jgi:hypothetical protein